MNTVHVSGRFVDEHRKPISGEIVFIPERLWVEEGEDAYATMTARQQLSGGSFHVELTPTDTQEFPWKYLVVCPSGTWEIEVPSGTDMLLLKDLFRKKLA